MEFVVDVLTIYKPILLCFICFKLDVCLKIMFDAINKLGTINFSGTEQREEEKIVSKP